MKKLQNLGRSLSKEEQKKVVGGTYDEGCTTTYTGCNNSPEYGGITCDYHIVCPSGSRDLCFAQCLPGDGGACAS